MKKIILFIVLLFPFNANASSKVISHFINAEIEIAGALNVKELIVVEGNDKTFSRNVNYRNIDKIWDGKTIDFKESPMYNGYTLEGIKISAFEAPKKIDFNDFTEKEMDYFNELDPKDKTKNFYTKVNNPLGANINIGYDSSKNTKTAYYIEYLITNVMVAHEDVKELNFTFLNLNYNAEDTLIRLILPYSTDSKFFKLWVHGPSSGELNYLVDSSKETVGAIASFPNLNASVNFRITIPKEHIGIDVYLNKTNVKALEEIIKVENNKLKNEKLNSNILKTVRYVVIFLSIIYVIGSFSLFKISQKNYSLLYILLGIILTAFNYIYKINIIYVYFVLAVPICVLLVKQIKNKK